MIIGTAGHIDHGKTSLVKALTGIDADRLPEEKARGITIDLGFAYVPDGAGKTVGFVDVPGHEKFVHTMVAGAAGMDHALLVVAADDGVMPQTREHLRIVDLLGVPELTTVITKIDMVDAARLETVRSQVAELVGATRFGNVLSHLVSAKSGAGIQGLRNELFTRAEQLQKHGSYFRLPIDRVFVVKGVGVAITGAVLSGVVRVGDTLLLGPKQLEVKVRSIHAQNMPAEKATVGTRCGIVLSGVEYADVARGDWLVAPELSFLTQRIDCRITVPADAERSVKDGEQLLLHYGTEHFLTRLIMLDAQELRPGQAGYAQCSFDKPLPICWHDRLVFRDSSARLTLAGGLVLDGDPPVRGRKKPERIGVLESLSQDGLSILMSTLLNNSQPVFLSRWSSFVNQPLNDLLAIAESESALVLMIGAQRYAVGQQTLAGLSHSTSSVLKDFHEREPDEPGLSIERLRRMAAPSYPLEIFKEIAQHLIDVHQLALTGSFVHLPDHRVTLTASEQVIWERIYPRLLEGQYDPPWVRDLAKDLGESENSVRTLLRKVSRTSQLAQVVPDLFYPVPTMQIMADIIRDLVEVDGSVTVITFKDRVHLGRKRAIQILEAFDRLGFTRRLVSYRRGKRELEKDHRIIRNTDLFRSDV